MEGGACLPRELEMWRCSDIGDKGTTIRQHHKEKEKKPAPESAALVEILDLVILPVVVMVMKNHGSVW